MKRVISLLLVLGATTIAPVLQAQGPAAPADVPGVAPPMRVLDVGPGMSSLLRLPQDSVRLAVADENVAKLSVVSEREVLVHGLALGRTTLYAWFKDSEVLQYLVLVQRDLSSLATALRELDPRLSVSQSQDGRHLVIRGIVDSTAQSAKALELAKGFAQGQPEPRPAVLDLLQTTQTVVPDADSRLADALRAIDTRIRVRRIQVDVKAKSEADTYVLEGRVRNLYDLVRAVMLAERQLGGTGSLVGAQGGDRRLTQRRQSNFTGANSQRSQGNAQGADIVGANQSPQSLGGQEALTAGLASQVARRMMITSDSGRVLSFLEVDHIEEIMVSIRVYEIDRGKARRLGVDYRVDGEHFSVMGLNRPAQQGLPSAAVQQNSVQQLGSANLVGSYVSDSISALAAVDLLQQKALARSVAEPNVVTLTGEEAMVMVGGEVPIPTVTANQISTVQGFAFQSFGVRLDIRPTADPDGIVTLEVAPSIVRPNEGLGSQGVPGFELQTVQTVARVRSGQSLILGGLINWEESMQERKVPLLGDIPLLKVFFKWNKHVRAEKELLFVMTPKVMEHALEGLTQQVRMPSPQIIDRARIGEETTAAHLTESGLPSSWVSAEEEAAVNSATATPWPAPPAAPAPSSADPGSALPDGSTGQPKDPASSAVPKAPQSSNATPAAMPAAAIVRAAATAPRPAQPQVDEPGGGRTTASAAAQADLDALATQLEAEQGARAKAEEQAGLERQARLEMLDSIQAERAAARARLAAEQQARTQTETQAGAERRMQADALGTAQADRKAAEARLAEERQARLKAEALAENERRARADGMAKARADQEALAAKLAAEQQALAARLAAEQQARAQAEARAAEERNNRATQLAKMKAEQDAVSTAKAAERPPPPAPQPAPPPPVRAAAGPPPPVNPKPATTASLLSAEMEATGREATAPYPEASPATARGNTPGASGRTSAHILPAQAGTGVLYRLDGTTRQPTPPPGDSLYDRLRLFFRGNPKAEP